MSAAGGEKRKTLEKWAFRGVCPCPVRLLPIIPCFVTMEDTDVPDGYGFPKQTYTIHVMPPLYPDPQKTNRENERTMQAENYRLCLEKYREVYGVECKYE